MEGYPVVLSLSHKPCLLVGGGLVAQRKVQRLLQAGAEVTVVSPALTKGLTALVREGKIVWRRRSYQEGDVKGFFLVFAASDNPAVNREVAQEAKARGVLCNVVDCPQCSSFLTPAVFEWEGICIAITSEGKSPFLVRFIREWLEGNFPQGLGEVLQVLEKERRMLKEAGIPLQEKKRRYRDILERWGTSWKGEKE
ncbi:MAG: bifunctional precorrin-2 dehydrogenase/sirohydrochlorin ferrochelatase [Atribacterota bacterium]